MITQAQQSQDSSRSRTPIARPHSPQGAYAQTALPHRDYQQPVLFPPQVYEQYPTVKQQAQQPARQPAQQPTRQPAHQPETRQEAQENPPAREDQDNTNDTPKESILASKMRNLQQLMRDMYSIMQEDKE